MPQQPWLTNGSTWSSRRMLWFQRNLISWWRKSDLPTLTPALNLSVLYTVQSFLQVFQDTHSPPLLLLATFILNVWCLLRWIWADKGIFKVPGACCRISIFLHTITLPFPIPHPDSHHIMLMWYIRFIFALQITPAGTGGQAEHAGAGATWLYRHKRYYGSLVEKETTPFL